jgi:hypothetical protein
VCVCVCVCVCVQGKSDGAKDSILISGFFLSA